MPELSTVQHKGLDIIVIKIHDLAVDDVPTTFFTCYQFLHNYLVFFAFEVRHWGGPLPKPDNTDMETQGLAHQFSVRNAMLKFIHNVVKFDRII